MVSTMFKTAAAMGVTVAGVSLLGDGAEWANLPDAVQEALSNTSDKVMDVGQSISEFAQIDELALDETLRNRLVAGGAAALVGGIGGFVYDKMTGSHSTEHQPTPGLPGHLPAKNGPEIS